MVANFVTTLRSSCLPLIQQWRDKSGGKKSRFTPKFQCSGRQGTPSSRTIFPLLTLPKGFIETEEEPEQRKNGVGGKVVLGKEV